MILYHHRSCSIQSTYDRIVPLSKMCGITRLLDLTRLDNIGISVYAATRPTGQLITVSNGKGATADAAKVSALMEGIETFHAENPDPMRIIYSSEESFIANNEAFLAYESYLRSPGCLDAPSEFFSSCRQIMPWIQAKELCSNKFYYLPASCVYYMEPFAHSFSSNGLASGNTYDEAVCHALYECVERDAFAKIANGVLDAYSRSTYLIDPCTLPRELYDLLSGYRNAGIKTYLFAIPSLAETHTFCCFSVSSFEEHPLLQVSLGLGTHSFATIAVTRAVTECAQSRLALIHGAREDLYWPDVKIERIYQSQDRLIQWLESSQKAGLSSWSSYMNATKGFRIANSFSLQRQSICSMLAEQGHSMIFCSELTRPEIGIDVVRIFCPTLSIDIKVLG